jgi:hypothetical protein
VGDLNRLDRERDHLSGRPHAAGSVPHFVRIHKTLKMAPAMAAGDTGKLWEVADLIALLPDEDSN